MIPIDAWRARGAIVGTADGRVFTLEAGEGAATPVLVLHGFPTSSWDFAEVVDLWAERRHVVCFDFLGFGLSDKPRDFGYSLLEQADVAVAVARARGLSRVHLVAHDMGTSVATELLARAERRLLPFEIESFALMNGSVHIELAHLTVGQQILKSKAGPLFARLNNRLTFKAQMRRLFAQQPTDAELDAMWELLSRDDGVLRLPKAIRYTEERALFRRRWIGALERTGVPALIAWGRRDPVAVMAIAERLTKDVRHARFEVWDDLGHYPQVEAPQRVATALEAFWGAIGGA